ncbi:hypothetical protein NDU88_008175 [Pleurodeles waltl]|uniref:Myb/SANT-like DNA-binding domain-containing protein n=1 Tax=Pleurodeles waltl TaxID=8319 RepID=A0AAV7QR02_PLEWA|nr:hypothetical protein NDU88_008175 [Pleurodeles waltl]
MAHVSGERVPAFSAEELEKLVDGVLPQYTLLCGPPDKQVSTHQKKGISRAITKEVQTLGVFHRRSTHCRKRWEDLRHWTKKTAEAQLGMASQGGRGCPSHHDPPDVPHADGGLSGVGWALEGIIAATKGVSRTQPSTSATKSPPNVEPATPRGSKGAPIREASVTPTPAKDQTIPPPAKVKKGPACSKGKEHDPPSEASSKPPADRAKGTTASAKVRKGKKIEGKALQLTEDAGEGLVPTSRTASPSPAPCASPPAAPPQEPPPLPAPLLPPLLSAAACPVGSCLRLQEKGWSLPPELAAPAPAPRPAPPASPPQAPTQAPPPAPLTVGPLPAPATPVGGRPRLQETSWSLPPPLAAPPPSTGTTTI